MAEPWNATEQELRTAFEQSRVRRLNADHEASWLLREQLNDPPDAVAAPSPAEAEGDGDPSVPPEIPRST
ncbi:MAG: hypothetical protein JWM10_4163 [Myxococcaceae bacterium]|nr:hypothetical protein [Myxococcaceae bacterium]